MEATTRLTTPPARISVSVPAAVALGLVLALATLLRVWDLGARGLWLDEAFSALYARLDWHEVIDLRRSGTNPPLYHFLLSLWVAAFGTSEVAVRAPSVLFGVLSVWAIYGLGRRLWDGPTGLWAAGLLAVSNMAIAYSQEARFYALNELTAILSTWAAYAWLQDRSGRTGLAYTVLAVVFVWLHTFAWLVLAAHLVWLVILVRRSPDPAERKRLARGALTAGGVVIVSFVPWVVVLIDQVRAVLTGYWIPRPRLVEPVVCLYDYLMPLRWPITRYVVANLAIAVAALALARRAQARPRSRHPANGTARGPLVLLLPWLILPVAIPFAWSCVGTPVFQIKYTIVAQPAAILLLARLAVRRPIPAMMLLAAVSLKPPTSPDYPLVVEDWREAAGIIGEVGPADGPVYMYRDYCTFPLAHYLGGDARIIPVLARDQGRSDFEGYTTRPALPFDVMLAQLQEQRGPAWLVLARVRGYGQDHFARVCRDVEAVRSVAGHWSLAEVDVLRLGPPGPVGTTQGANR